VRPNNRPDWRKIFCKFLLRDFLRLTRSCPSRDEIPAREFCAVSRDVLHTISEDASARWRRWTREALCVRNYNITWRRDDDYHDAREKRMNRRRGRARRRKSEKEKERDARSASGARKKGRRDTRKCEALRPPFRDRVLVSRRIKRADPAGRIRAVDRDWYTGAHIALSNLRASDNRWCMDTAWVTSKHLRGATSREAAQLSARDGLSGAVSLRSSL